MNSIFSTSSGQEMIDRVYDPETQAMLRETLEFAPGLYNRNELESRRDDLREVEVIFSTWGMFDLTEGEIAEYLPKLKAVFYGAGSVQDFARPFLNSGVRVFSAFAANAVPVAEYTVAQIILAGKGMFQAMGLYKQKGHAASRGYTNPLPCNYNEKVGIIGAGAIGRMVIERLRAYKLEVLVFDPFLPREAADALGVTLCGLEELFESCQVVSNHLANNAQTQGMLDYSLFSKMRPTATFLNTGRGAQVVEADLARALTEVPTRTAVLDVTWPEPVEEGNPFLTMDNVFLTPHIAGSMGNEVARMGFYMLEEYRRFAAGEKGLYEVDLKMLETMA
ncbi:MAG: hydroxyacid dehydrogenase [Oscillospiraceae bacterium]